MADYFADTSFWEAIVDRRDSYHAQAIKWSLTMSGRVVTTEAVLLETANTFSRPAWRQHVIALIDHLLVRDDVEIVPFSEASWSLGWDLFRGRLDKSWSLTDFISFEVMRERSLAEALTADLHFAQAGFNVLLK